MRVPIRGVAGRGVLHLELPQYFLFMSSRPVSSAQTGGGSSSYYLQLHSLDLPTDRGAGYRRWLPVK